MKKAYSFLSDELAVEEIRKHKWIESEKQGKEIGFATAALDWITKYGDSWQESKQLQLKEKRQYRRFYQRFPLQLSLGNSRIQCYTDNINFQGVACTVEGDFSTDEPAQVTLHLNKKGLMNARDTFKFQSRVARLTRGSEQKDKESYKIFLPFPADVQNALCTKTEVFTN